MTKPNYTHLTVIADRSGSMVSMREDAQGGINTMVKEQTTIDGDITISLYEFDHDYHKVYGPIDAREAPSYTLEPRGSTALIDSVVRAIDETGAWLKDLPENERPEHVVFTIVTDGGENASHKFKLEDLQARVSHQQDKYDWEFLFLGANIDAFSEGNLYGFGSSIQYSNTGASVKGAYAVASSALLNTRSTGATIDSFVTDNNTVDTEGNVTKTANTSK